MAFMVQGYTESCIRLQSQCTHGVDVAEVQPALGEHTGHHGPDCQHMDMDIRASLSAVGKSFAVIAWPHRSVAWDIEDELAADL